MTNHRNVSAVLALAVSAGLVPICAPARGADKQGAADRKTYLADVTELLKKK